MKKQICSTKSTQNFTDIEVPFAMDFKNGCVLAPPNVIAALVDHPLDSDFANVLCVSNYEYGENETPIPPIIFFTKTPSPKWNLEFMEHIIDRCEEVAPELHKIREVEVIVKGGHFYNGDTEKTLQDFLDSPKILAHPLHGELPGVYEVVYKNTETEDYVNQLYDAAIWN